MRIHIHLYMACARRRMSSHTCAFVYIFTERRWAALNTFNIILESHLSILLMFNGDDKNMASVDYRLTLFIIRPIHTIYVLLLACCSHCVIYYSNYLSICINVCVCECVRLTECEREKNVKKETTSLTNKSIFVSHNR